MDMVVELTKKEMWMACHHGKFAIVLSRRMELHGMVTWKGPFLHNSTLLYSDWLCQSCPLLSGITSAQRRWKKAPYAVQFNPKPPDECPRRTTKSSEDINIGLLPQRGHGTTSF